MENAVTYSNQQFESNSRRQAAGLSRHAGKRAQQRGIDKASVPLVVAYGSREFDGNGGIRYLMTKESMDLLRRAVGRSQQVDALAGVYAVVSAEDQTVITIGHRHD
jgi:hypothetical protein